MSSRRSTPASSTRSTRRPRGAEGALTEAFQLQVRPNRLATLTFDLPDSSVNIFTEAVLAELDGLVREDLAQRTDIGCLVLLSGKPNNFIAGADVDLIAGVTDALQGERGSRAGQLIFEAWERLPFPTISAISGTCVGGGTELSLACDYIVASDRENIRIGLPEVRLGILPGWGGCVRMPERVGLTAALDMILSGKLVPAKKAMKIGLLDALFPEASFRHLVRDFALARLDGDGLERKRGDFRTRLLEGNPIGRTIVFDQARKRTLEATKGHYPAPLRALEVVKTGIERGRKTGFETEARAEGELVASATCKNLIHVFRLMEGAKKDPAGTPAAAPVRRAAVLGAGVMGGGIAQLLAARADLPVRLKDIDHAPLASGMAHAASLFQKLVARRRLSKPEARRRMGLLRPTLDYRGFEQADIVIEAIVENLEIKQRVFAEIASQVADDTVLASNTSSLSIDLIARDTPSPERVVGMHFFNPVHKMPLVEVVVGSATSDAATRTVVDLSRRLGKTPVVVRNGPGFLVNRLLTFYNCEALWLLEEGHRIDELDSTMVAWGMPMGPMALIDEVGIDVATKVGRIMQDAFPDRLAFPDWIDRMTEADRLGAKSSRGLYLYEKGRRREPDPDVYERLGTSERAPGSMDVADRMVLPMVNEAARALDEAIVASPGDLDLAMIMGTGFPPFRGGLCRWADSQGLTRLVDEMDRLAETVDPRHSASAAMRRFAEDGSFYAV